MLILLLSLDSLGNHFHTEVARECGDGADDRVVVVGREAHDKRSIDLEIVERETMQVAERRITGSKVVDTQLHAQRAQLLEHQCRRLCVLHDHALGDLELQAVRTQLAVFERFFDPFQQIRLRNLSRRKVHTQAQRAVTRRIELPLPHVRASFIQHPLANRNDQTSLFSNGNKVSR